VVIAATNLTQHTAFGALEAAGIPRLAAPRVAATTDNRLVLAWSRAISTAGGLTTDILYAVLDTEGQLGAGPTALTAGTPGGDEHVEPALAALTGGRALLAYNASGQLAGAVLAAGGAVEQAPALLGVAGARPDAARLAGGAVLLGWAAETGAQAAMLTDAPLALASAPVSLTHPLAADPSEVYVSVAGDEDGRGLITWSAAGPGGNHLYYALLEASGAVLTPPRLLRGSPAGLDTSHAGAGLAPWTRAGLRRQWMPIVFR
jgi:hypothetical protein